MGNTPTIEEKDPLHIALKNKEPKNIILELAKDADLYKRDLNGRSYRYNALKNLYPIEVIKKIVPDDILENAYKTMRNRLTFDVCLLDALRNKMSDEIVIPLINEKSKAASTKFDVSPSMTITFDLSYEGSTHFLAKEMGYSEEILSLLETTYEEREECSLNKTINAY